MQNSLQQPQLSFILLRMMLSFVACADTDLRIAEFQDEEDGATAARAAAGGGSLRGGSLAWRPHSLEVEGERGLEAARLRSVAARLPASARDFEIGCRPSIFP